MFSCHSDVSVLDHPLADSSVECKPPTSQDISSKKALNGLEGRSQHISSIASILVSRYRGNPIEAAYTLTSSLMPPARAIRSRPLVASLSGRRLGGL